jgi:DNA-binding transcriptional regulator LsrR (DeoR family)
MQQSQRKEIQQMILAARLYYEEGITQEDVSRKLGISRPTTSRLLQRAKEEGIVQISINDPFSNDQDLATQIMQRFGLETAIIVPALSNKTELNLKQLGLATAHYLEETLKTDEILGVGWGRTLYTVSQSIVPTLKRDLLAVPLLGGLGQINPNFQVHEITRSIAEAFGGSWKQMYVPALVHDEETCKNLHLTKEFCDIADIWAKTTTALVGIGNIDFDTEMKMLFASYLNEESRAKLQKNGAVGDICMRFFDINGNPVEGLVGATGIDLSKIHQIQRVIAVAGNPEKANAILGALHGGFVQVLITDTLTAERILTLSRSEDGNI